MTTKRTLILLGRTLLSTFLIILFLFSFELIESFNHTNYDYTRFFQKLGKVTIAFFLLFSAFFATNEWLRIKNKTQKPFPYFLYAIGTPVLLSVVMCGVRHYTSFLGRDDIHLLYIETIAYVIIIMFLLAAIHYLKYNFKTKNSTSKKIAWKTKSMYKKVAIYALVLTFLYMIYTVIFYIYHGGVGLNYLNLEFLFFMGKEYVFNFCIAFLCWHLVVLFYSYLETKVSILGSLIITTLGIFVIMELLINMYFFLKLLMYTDYDIVIKNFNFIYLITGVGDRSVFVIICTLCYQFLYFNETRSTEQKALKAAIGKQTEKYESLRRQLSPHFLFNNINVLTALIEENPQKAVRFSESLGNIYRHFLRQEDEDIVSLQSALLFSKDYLELLKYRYEEAFQYVLPKTVASHQYIIPLALQQVIENTIKHNEVSAEKPLQITIEIQDDYISIQNTKQLKATIENTKGTGIENIQKRYAFLTEKEVVIQDEAASFTIKLPLLNMENA